MVAVVISARTVRVCKDILRDKDPMLHYYVWFGVSYFAYDLIVMYIGTYYEQCKESVEENHRHINTHGKSIKTFFQKECLIVVHHLISLFIGFPIVVVSRL